jgi:TRAP-type C4-dicarboxylate transport system permease small subunit
VVCLCVISKPQQRGALGPLALWNHKKHINIDLFIYVMKAFRKYINVITGVA